MAKTYAERNAWALTKPEELRLELSGHSDTDAIMEPDADDADSLSSPLYVRADVAAASLRAVEAERDAALAEAKTANEMRIRLLNQRLSGEWRDADRAEAFAEGLEAATNWLDAKADHAGCDIARAAQYEAAADQIRAIPNPYVSKEIK